MLLRDSALAASGLLDGTLGGAPVYPYQPERVWEPLAITKERDFAYPASQGNDLYRRSLYTFWRRTIAPANMFDVSQRQSCRVRVETTNSPLHALTTLNDPTWIEAARMLAQCVMHESSEARVQLASAFVRVIGRVPSEREATLLDAMLARQREFYSADREATTALLSIGASPRDSALLEVDHAALTGPLLASEGNAKRMPNKAIGESRVIVKEAREPCLPLRTRLTP